MALIQANPPINFGDLVFKDEISDKMYDVVHRLTRKIYSVKEFNHAYSSSERENISREIEILKTLDHPNVVKFYEIFYIGDIIFLLFEPIGCPLFEVSETDFTSETDGTFLVNQALVGLRYLHQNKIWHGDFNPSNIFVNHLWQAKVLYLGKTLTKTDLYLRRRALGKTAVVSSEDELERIHEWIHEWNMRLYTLAMSKFLNWCSPSFQDEGQLLSFASSCMKRWTVEQLLILTRPTSYLLKEKGVFAFEVNPLSAGGASSELTTEEGTRHDEDRSSIEPHLKSCIEHCALFFPDCEFEKEKLVRMWIAEDCIELQDSKRREDTANSYFEALVEKNIIMPSEFDHGYRQMRYKLNISAAFTWFKEPEPSKYIRIDADNFDELQFYEQVLHLTWRCKKIGQTLCHALKNFKQLRTLIVLGSVQLPNEIFFALKLLRTLDLSRTNVSELPHSIEYLESLRCLDISDNPIKRLPESVDRLRHLQSLILRCCSGISELPRGLAKLINLRHLDLDTIHQLQSMPEGMGNLIELQTLPGFIVGKSDECGIKELKYMNEITGSFCISHLENVSSIEEAKEASLCDKKHIDDLTLSYDRVHKSPDQDTAEILECLQPHFQLKEFELSFYTGSKLPSWMSNPSFTELSSVTLLKCINCDILPSLGVLPSLKILHILYMNNLKRFDTLPCRNEGFNAFPKLEKFILYSMADLEEWIEVKDGDFPRLLHISITSCPELCVLPSFSHFCSLQYLTIDKCTKLTSLPEGLLPGTLKSLMISGCPEISERCKVGGADRFKIASVRDVTIDFEDIYVG